jgi:hypothetical protein
LAAPSKLGERSDLKRSPSDSAYRRDWEHAERAQERRQACAKGGDEDQGADDSEDERIARRDGEQQRREDHSIHEREHGRRDTDAQRKRQDNDSSEPRVAASARQA